MHVCSTRLTRLIALGLLLCLAFTACVAYAAESDAKAQASLYFNPDGGKYYHADDNCVSVRDKYLPLKPIPNDDLTAEPYALLTACPLCVIDTALYFNPDGGKYYHADDNCVSVRDKYLPLKPIPNADLTAEPYALLTACPLCAAEMALYFNPDGGKYYHADDNCVSVRDKYLPLKPIPNDDLSAEPYALLTACPLCVIDTALYFNPDGGKYYHADESCVSISDKYLPLKPIPNADLTAEPYALLTACPLCAAEMAQ